MDPELAEMLDSVITIEPYVSMSGAGDVTYGPSYTLSCLIAGKVKMIRTVKGQEKISDTQLYLSGVGAESLAEDDRITLPNGLRRQILTIAYYTEKGQQSLLEVYL